MAGALVGAQRRGAELSAARPLFAELEASLQQEIAARMVKRPQVINEARARLEIEIDLRLLARAAFIQAMNAAAGSDAQANARLRGRLFLDAIATVESALDRQQNNLSPPQAEAAKGLQRLTFVEVKNAKDLDALSRQFAPILLALTGQQGVDAARLPPLRPRPAPASRDEGPAGATLQQMAEEVNRLNISIPLRQQLAALAGRAANPPGVDEDARVKESALLTGTLRDSLELARALALNTAIQPDARLAMESQLGEGIALLMDHRTRALGQARLSAMSQYRQATARIARLNLSREQSEQFGPLFTWARTAGAAGSRAMAAVEHYLKQRRHFEARSRTPHPIPAFQRTVAEVEKQFSTAAAAFVSAAGEVSRSPSRAGALDTHVEEMRRAADLLEALDHMPITLDALGQFKPRPGGGALDRRVAQAAQAIVNPTGNDNIRAASITLMLDLHRLGQLALELSRVDLSNVSATVQRKCAGGRLPALNQKWRDLVTQLASEAAAGNDLKQADLNRLAQVQVLHDAVKQATVLEAALMDGGVLERWVDWRMGPEHLKPLFIPYQEAMSQAFAGYVSDQPEALETWTKLERRYRPVIDLMVRAGAYRDQCANFPPPGPINLAAAFNTSLEGAPFAAERLTALYMDVYKHVSDTGNTAAAIATLNAYLSRLAAD
jgi:hypothetical protein